MSSASPPATETTSCPGAIPRPWRRHLLTGLQFAVTLSLLIYLFHDPRRREDMWNAFATADWRWMLLSFLAAGLCEFLGVLRWQLFLRMLRIHVPLGETTRLFFIGAFFNQFLPGTTGGDVARVLYLMHDRPGHKTEGFLSVAVDRLIAILVLVVLGLFFAWYRSAWFAQSPIPADCMKWFSLTLIALSLFLILSFVLTSRQLVCRLPRRVPLRRLIIKLSKLWQLCLANRRETMLGTIYTVPMLLAYFAAFGFAAKAFSRQITFIDMTTIMPLVTAISSLPLSVNGIGPREAFINELLHKLCHVPHGVGTVISLAGASMYLLWGLLGGLFYLDRLRRSCRTTLPSALRS